MIRLVGRFTAAAGRRLVGRQPALAALTVVGAGLAGGGSAMAAATPAPIAPSSVFSIPAASGSLTGADGRHLTLRLTGTRDHLTRFADGPSRQTLVVANVAFARRFKHDFAGTRPRAVLTYTRSAGQIPASIGLTIGRPRWDAHHHAWAFTARRTRGRTDDARGSAHRRGSTTRTFIAATLLIDDAENCEQRVVRPYEDCANAHLAFVNLTGADLTGVNFVGADLTGANLTGADLIGANFSDANLTDAGLTAADLTDSDLAGEDLSDQVFIGADLHDADLIGADLVGAVLPGVNVSGANLSGAKLSNTDLSDANLTDTDLAGADVSGAELGGARLCGAILPGGRIAGGC